jgi:galactosylceramidase
MAGLKAGGGKKNLSTPYFDNLLIKGIGAPIPKPASENDGQTPIYQTSETTH